MKRLGLLLALACVPAKAAPAPTPARYGCAKPLAACTRDRVQQLKLQSRRLAAAAKMKPPAGLSAEKKKSLQAYDDWLRAKSAQLDALADRYSTEQGLEGQMTFNSQYLALQDKMKDESRRYAAVSSIMKTKHDAVKNSISNAR